jgi:hypothetical protein
MAFPSSDENNSDKPSKEPTSSSSWFFSSWFENDPLDLRTEIHEKLNDYEERKKRFEEQMRQQQQQRRTFFGMPFFPGAPFGHHQHHHRRDTDEGVGVEQELEDLFNKMSEELNSGSSTFRFSSSSSSSSSVVVRESTRDGFHMQVKLPHDVSVEDVAVDVVRESPCEIQYRVGNSNQNGGDGSIIVDDGRRGMRTRPVQKRVRVGDYIDCSNLSASISEAQKMLTVTAPVKAPSSQEQQKARSIPVTQESGIEKE